MWRESLHCTLVWMILQTKHEITSIHLNDQLHWLYLANSNNLPLLLPTPSFLLALSFSLHLSNLIFHSSLPQTSSPFLISSPLSNVLSLLLYLYNLYHLNPSSLSFPLFTLQFISLFLPVLSVPSLVSVVVFWSFCCSVLHTGILQAHGGSEPIDWDSRIEKLTTNGNEEQQMQMVIYKLYVTGKQ